MSTKFEKLRSRWTRRNWNKGEGNKAKKLEVRERQAYLDCRL